MLAVERHEKSGGSVRWVAVRLLWIFIGTCYSVPVAHGLTANWTESNLDLFFYHNAEDPGQRFLSPTFANEFVIEAGTQHFEQLTLDSPARLGAALFAFNTASAIDPIASGYPPSRHRINSVTFRASFTYDGSIKRIQYDNQQITQSELLGEYLPTGSVTAQRPVELYGVGFRAGYSGFEFGTNDGLPPLIDELNSPYPAPQYGYIAYPIERTETSPGVFSNVDVMNSATGGYSETAVGKTTAPFTADPWAIGTTNLAVGADIPDLTTFTFSLNLDKPGVRAYLQESLSNGAVGFFLSTLHSTGVMGAGGGYPRWITKEASGFVPASKLPLLTIDYDVLPAVPSDYNGNGVVDSADYILWRKGGPLLNQVDDPSQVNQQDYVEWRARFGNSVTGAGFGTGPLIPEPAAISFLIQAAMLSARARCRRNV